MESLKHLAYKINPVVKSPSALYYRVKNFGQKHLRALSGLPDEVYISSIIILVGLAGFSLGRLSALEENKTPIKITHPQEASAVSAGQRNPSGETEMNLGGYLVASKSGTKYHFPWCAGAQQINEANKIYFKSAEKARAAGYSPASNCKGLE